MQSKMRRWRKAITPRPTFEVEKLLDGLKVNVTNRRGRRQKQLAAIGEIKKNEF
jgi:hypothetical protein